MLLSLPLELKLRWVLASPFVNETRAWFRKLNAAKRKSRFSRSLILIFLVTARSLLQNFGPAMYGNRPLPIPPAVGSPKQLPLAYCPFFNPDFGLQVRVAYAVI